MKFSLFIFIIIFLVSFQLNSEGTWETELIDTFSYSGIKSIVIEGKAYDVIISGYTGTEVKVEIYAPDNHEYHVKYKKSGSNIKLWSDNDPQFYFFKHVIGNPRIEVKVPQNITIEIDNSSGDIILSDIKTDEVDLKTSSGDIEVERVKALISSTSSSGDQKFSNIDSNKTYLRASSGDIEGKGIKGDLIVKTSSGDISFNDCLGSFDLSASSGDISINQSDGDIECSTSSGDQFFKRNRRKYQLTFIIR